MEKRSADLDGSDLSELFYRMQNVTVERLFARSVFSED